MMTGDKRSSDTAQSVSPERYPRSETPKDGSPAGSPEPPVSPAVRRNMQANRGRDTGPEMLIRSALHAMGLRFRVSQPLPFDRRRRADITFPRVGLYVFVDGCFWHHCSEHFVVPKTRTEFWMTKILGNEARDAETNERIRQSGGTVIRIWEHDDPIEAVNRIAAEYSLLCDRAAKRSDPMSGRSPSD